MFYQNLEKLCQANGVSMNRFASDIGLSSAAVTGWKSGAIPRNNTLRKIADYFGVTVDYLMWDDEIFPIETDAEKKPTADFDPLTTKEKFILEMWRDLDETGQNRLMIAVLHRYDIERCRMQGIPNPYADEDPAGTPKE